MSLGGSLRRINLYFLPLHILPVKRKLAVTCTFHFQPLNDPHLKKGMNFTLVNLSSHK